MAQIGSLAAHDPVQPLPTVADQLALLSQCDLPPHQTLSLVLVPEDVHGKNVVNLFRRIFPDPYLPKFVMFSFPVRLMQAVWVHCSLRQRRPLSITP